MTANPTRSLLIILSLISAILITVLILGTYDIRFKNKEASRLLNLADETTKKEILAQSIRMMQNTALEDIKAFNNIILSDDKLVPLFEDIENSARNLGFDIEISSVEKVKSADSIGLDTIRMVIEARGSWASNLSFLNVIENLPNRVLIDESNLSKQADSWYLRVVLSLYSYN